MSSRQNDRPVNPAAMANESSPSTPINKTTALYPKATTLLCSVPDRVWAHSTPVMKLYQNAMKPPFQPIE
ncbi:hypothetical protein D3C73_1485190 [compost metagenome]